MELYCWPKLTSNEIMVAFFSDLLALFGEEIKKKLKVFVQMREGNVVQIWCFTR